MPITEQAAGASAITDRSVAMDMLKDCKFCVTTFAKAATEASNTQVRQFINQSLNDVANEQFKLSDIIVNKGWYHPFNITEQMQQDFQMVALLNSQRNQIS